MKSDDVQREEERRTEAAMQARFSEFLMSMYEGAPVRPFGVEPMTLTELVASLTQFGTHALPEVRDEDDPSLTEMIHVVGRDRDVLGVLPGLTEDRGQAAFRFILPGLVSAASARSFGFIHHVWTLPEGTEWKEGDPRPSDHPDRVEKVHVIATDGLRYLRTMATVLRPDDQPATLMPWDKPTEGDVEDIGGMFIPAVEMLRHVRLSVASRHFILGRPAEWWTFARREAWGVMMEQITASADGESRGGGVNEASLKAFETLYLDNVGEMWPEIPQLAFAPSLYDLPIPDYRDNPWETEEVASGE